MGMFDEYEPAPALCCPDCEATLEGWQGKDGPCGLLHFKMGDVVEVCKDWRDWGFTESDKGWVDDTSRFELHTSCKTCERWIEAIGTKDAKGRWASTTLLLPGKVK